jgi:hypothetical protein
VPQVPVDMEFLFYITHIMWSTRAHTPRHARAHAHTLRHARTHKHRLTQARMHTHKRGHTHTHLHTQTLDLDTHAYICTCINTHTPTHSLMNTLWNIKDKPILRVNVAVVSLASKRYWQWGRRRARMDF